MVHGLLTGNKFIIREMVYASPQASRHSDELPVVITLFTKKELCEGEMHEFEMKWHESEGVFCDMKSVGGTTFGKRGNQGKQKYKITTMSPRDANRRNFIDIIEKNKFLSK